MELIKVEIPDGLSPQKANEVKEAFKVHIDAMGALEPEFEQILAQIDGDPTEEQMAVAKDLRKRYVKTRTGTQKTHKELKADALNYGRYLDGWRSAQKTVCEHREEKLKDIEEFQERKEAAALAQKIKDRNDELVFHGLEENPSGIDVLDDDAWNAYLEGAIQRKRAEKEQAEKEAAEQLAKEEELQRLRKEKDDREREERERRIREDEEAKRKADADHQEIIHREIFSDLVGVGQIEPDSADFIVNAIISGNIRHLSINY